MALEQQVWKRSRPLWFRLPRLARIGWILVAVALGPWRRRLRLAPDCIRALLLVRDLYSPLPGLVESLLQQGLRAQHILLLDSGSTNPTCLATLAALEQSGCRWIRLSPQEQRFGPYAPWLSRRLRAQIRGWRYPYLVSDPDLALPTSIPSDWLAQLFSMLNQHRSVLKVALPLTISDITLQNSAAIKAHEEGLNCQTAYRLLSRCLLGKSSEATICTTDTTLALYRPAQFFSTLSIRLPLRYAIKHLPWYTEFCASCEYHYYQAHKLNLFGEWSSVKHAGPPDHVV
ncbi:glycosyltransferase family 2 protein [Cyanobium sp. WKJ7-Wakatipu]|uniref:glycosyltransferase family A protein n=1 Tax=Cyanobium sp. WKJ7-Wakatipu TaxID=2823726 RepID=UPI0020CD9B6B|nr:glycosyltransferase family A protein [Cyanobium sp. WKJ7-Wakatipu]MCP9783283.1 glycosyltransferase family 2 protein [Cyanobium sp. WKJ7-Wakatipu]